ncbi:hypothetical protein TRFO_10746 [Tritrichomonas foetus]|uniref:sn-1-specific diacylglycerol lipase n=1 Tax=Tritrichomonas foetus TaxID=1144522 RepID=A0A1J4J721_9EUKA|nr:hypothetical protein TRFO_10746 [Tritrichomonas foetus]|eukprot:OHS95030.1 hypothetical protein TRFO_10746 [Tritrichomonas foetus]
MKIQKFSATFIALIQLCARLAQAAYDGNIDTKYQGQILYSNLDCRKEKPVFYIFKLDGVLYVSTRGSSDAADFATDVIFEETKTDYGIFHTGFFDAASFVYDSLKNYLDDSTEVRLVGHSYGAAVSQVLHVMLHRYNPSVRVTSFAFAPVPSMNQIADDEVRDDMYAFVNDDDIIPTLSIPNCYKKFTFLFPTLHNIPSDTIIEKVDGLLKIIKFTSILDEGTFNMIWDAVPIIVINAKAYEEDVPKYVRYVSGKVYQLKAGRPKALSRALINQEIFLDELSVTLNCISDHLMANYIKVVDEIIEG